MVNNTTTTGNDNNIASLTSPLKTQYIAFNPMDNKLLHLLVAESQYLQFIKVLTTSRYNANRLLSLQSLMGKTPQRDSNDFQDLLRSFSSDTTGDTHTEVLTETGGDVDDQEEDDNGADSVRIMEENKNILIHNNDINDTRNLIQNLEFSSDEEGEELTFEDLERYEELLNDFESTRDESNVSTNGEIQPQLDTDNFLRGLSDDEDDSAAEANNSFTKYLREKFANDEAPYFMSNPQEFLRKVSKIWKLVPQNLNLSGPEDDINKSQFQEFFKKWKENHKTINHNNTEVTETELVGQKLLYKKIQRDPDIEVPEEEVTDELIEEKISVLSKKEPSSPFDFFYNDQLREILSKRQNFNSKKKQINSEIMIQWEKVSVLEKARYSSINIDEHRKKGVQFASPVKRAVSYHGSRSSSKLSSPQRSISTCTTFPVISNIPELKFSPKLEPAILTPPVSPPDSDTNYTNKGVVNEKVKLLNKKKSWGKDDKWL